ncbi:hypothetical protein D3C87_1811250 [compost metagenome]
MAGMISTRAITGAGLKKWIPITLSDFLQAAAIEAIDREEVLEARIQLSCTKASSCAKTAFFISRFSMIASIIRPLSFSAARSLE